MHHMRSPQLCCGAERLSVLCHTELLSLRSLSVLGMQLCISGGDADLHVSDDCFPGVQETSYPPVPPSSKN